MPFDYTSQHYPTGFQHYGGGFEVTDLDGDGLTDLVVGNYNANSVTVWEYDETSESLTAQVAIGGFPGNIHDVASADIDGDGDPDLLVGTRGHGVYTVENLGSGNYGVPAGVATPYSFEILPADLNGDGNVDFFHGTIGFANVYYGNGSGGFNAGAAPAQVVPSAPGRSQTLIDLDGDGDLDVIGIQDSTTTSRLAAYLNLFDGGGSWSGNIAGATPPIAGRSPTVASPAAGDFNGDGFVDVVALKWTTPSGPTEVLIYDGGETASGDLTWTPRVLESYAESANFVVTGDINDDGLDDILLGSNGIQSGGIEGLYAYLSSGDGSFEKTTVSSDGFYGSLNDGAIADINGDGFTDIAVSRWTASGAPDGFEVFYGYPAPVECDMFLFKDKSTDAGDVVFANKDGALAVDVSTQDGWELGSLKLHVGDVDPATGELEGFPVNQGGNLKLGHFDHKAEVDMDADEFVIDVAALEAADTNHDGLVALAIHGGFEMEVAGPVGSTEVLDEAGWAWCEDAAFDFPGQSGAYAVLLDLTDLGLL